MRMLSAPESTEQQERQRHSCVRCGYASAHRWRRCPRCLAFASAQKAREPDAELALRDRAIAVAAPLSSITTDSMARRSTGMRELDRVIGQDEAGELGIAPGQAIVLGGEPGIGKSTLLLQALAGLTRGASSRVLYASGEESREQIAARARRLGLDVLDQIEVLETRRLEDIERALSASDYSALVVDSMQAIAADDIGSEPGGVRQVKAIAERLTSCAKARGFALWLVGQATKDGRIAGPLAAAHAVDTVIWFEADPSGAYRTIRASKNRFGAAGELALFEMRSTGLVEVSDPSALFVRARRESARPPGSAWAMVAELAQPLVLEAQALVVGEQRRGDAPRRVAAGIDTGRLSLLIAVLERRAGLALGGDVYVDLDAGLRVSERALDLPLALALGSAAQSIALPAGLASCGEIALTGEVRPVPRLQVRLQEAARLGFTHALVPAAQVDSIDERALEPISIEPVATIADALEALELA